MNHYESLLEKLGIATNTPQHLAGLIQARNLIEEEIQNQTRFVYDRILARVKAGELTWGEVVTLAGGMPHGQWREAVNRLTHTMAQNLPDTTMKERR